MSELKDKTLSGIAWTTFSQIVKQVFQFAISIVLARLLVPEDFGLIGMIAVFTGFAGVFRELGFGAALVQKPGAEERHRTSIFWLNLVTGLALTGILIAVAPLIAAFYGEPRLTSIMRLIAVNFSIDSLSIVQTAVLNRSMRFRPLALVEAITNGVAGVIGIVLAALGYGVWSLVWQLLITSGVRALALWKLIGWRPQWSFDWAAVRELLGFSGNLFGYNIFNYWVRNGDNLLVGKFIGTVGLGIYARAYSIMLLPITQVTQILGQVMFPALSIVQNDKEHVKRIYLRSTAMIALLTFPMMMGLWVVADHFVLALYGSKWADVISLLRIFCLLGMVQSISATTGWVFQSQGRTDVMFRWRLYTGGLLIGGFVIGILIGTVEAVAAIYAFTSGVLMPYPLFTVTGKLIDMTFGDVARSVAGILICATAMAAAVWAFGLLLPHEWPDWLCLAAQVSLGAAVYVTFLHLFDIEAYSNAKTLLVEQLTNRRKVSLSKAN